MIAQIVTNSFILKSFSKIDIFKRELGLNLTGPVDTTGKGKIKIKIRDEFVQKYNNNTGGIIFIFGSIGSLKFYQDEKIRGNNMLLFDENAQIYDIEVEDINELIDDPRSYLSNIISEVENLTSSEKLGNSSGNIPDEDPPIDLPYDQYIDELKKRRKSLTKVDLNDPQVQQVINKKREEILKRNLKHE